MAGGTEVAKSHQLTHRKQFLLSPCKHEQHKKLHSEKTLRTQLIKTSTHITLCCHQNEPGQTILQNHLVKDINYRAYAAFPTATQHFNAAALPSYNETEKQLFPAKQAHHLKLLDTLWLPFL